MEPTTFAESNSAFVGEGYKPVVAYYDRQERTGMVVTCYTLSWRERLKLLVTGRLWLSQLTFHEPLQPQRPDIDNPFVAKTWTGRLIQEAERYAAKR